MSEDHDKLIAQFNSVIEQDPRNVEAHFGRGSAFLDEGRYGKAIADFDRVLSLEPGHSQAAESRDRAVKLRDIDDQMKSNIVRDW